MSTTDSAEARERQLNRLTVATLVLTGIVALIFLLLFIFPSLSPFGPKSDPSPVAMLTLPSATPTTPPTWTAAPTWTRPPTETPFLTDTPLFSATPSRTAGPTPTFPPTWTPKSPPGTSVPTRSNYPFALQNNEIIYTQYFFSSECNWLGIAGLVVDKEGNPVLGLPVVLNGGGLQNVVTNSGNAPAYGESGWEHFLDNKVKEGDFTIQLYNNKPEPISDQIHVKTRADCRANLIMIVFEQNWDEYVP
jgi:hypothetical protein